MKKDNLAIVDVQVNEPSKVPPRYYFEPGVQEALRRAIRADVVINGKECPSGVAPVYGPHAGTTAAASIRLRVARSDFFQSVMRELPGLIVIYLALLATGLIFVLVRGS